MGMHWHGMWPVLQAYLADTASPESRDAAFGLYFALALGVGSIWSGILGWIIDHFGFNGAFLTMAISYIVAGLLLFLIPTKNASRVVKLTEGCRAGWHSGRSR